MTVPTTTGTTPADSSTTRHQPRTTRSVTRELSLLAILIIGVLPLWNRLRRAPRVQRALKGVNAGVVGLLAAALYDPVFNEGVTGPHYLVIVAVAFVALTAWKAPAWAVVLGAAGLGALLL